LNRVALFGLFVAAGVQISDKIVDLRFLQDVGEGWHLMAALKYLCAYLIFAECAAYSGEVRPFGTAVFADGVAVLATVVSEDRRSMTLVSWRSECGKERCGCKKKDERGA
jgi:hypothetical protein